VSGEADGRAPPLSAREDSGPEKPLEFPWFSG